MRKFIFSIFLVTMLASLNSAQAQEDICYNPNLIKDSTKKSIKSVAVGIIGKDSVIISYHSPGVRKRIIWGGLVPYDEVWVTGAHDATTIEVKSPFVINNVKISPGKYALFTIPGKKEWTVIINKHWKQHLASEYDVKDDVVRFTVKPKNISHLERLQYFVEPVSSDNGRLAIAWEKIRIEFPITIK